MITPARVALALAVLLAAAPAQAYVTSGKVSGSANKLVYIDKFCYGGSKHNEFKWDVPSTPGLYLVALVDTKESYSAWRSKTLNDDDCKKLTSLGVNDFTKGFSVNLGQPPSSEVQPTLTSRPHFWRVYALSCDGSYSGVKYTITFKNDGSQFSQDMSGIIWLYVAFFILFSILLAVWTFGCCRLRQMMNYIHPLVKILTAALMTQFLSVALFCVQYATFYLNGRGFLVVLTFARVLEMGSILVFTFFLLCLAKGWTVTTSVLSQRWLLIIVFSFYAFFYLLLLLWNLYATEHGSEDVTSFYSSVPGICLIVVRLLTMLWFLWCNISTISGGNISSDKRVFLGIYCGVGSVWFMTMPVIVVLSLLLSSWNRGVLVESTFQIATYLLYTVFVYLMWPSRAERYFRISAQEYLYDSVANDEL